MSRIAYNNLFLSPTGSGVTYVDVGETFNASLPLSNLSKMQLSVKAQFDGETAEFTVDTGSTIYVSVLALLGHNLPDDTEVEFLDGATSLGVVVVENHEGLPRNAILVLDEQTAIGSPLTVSITSAGSGAHDIGAVWASKSYPCCLSPDGFGYAVDSLSDVSWASGTGYASPRASQDVPTFKFTPMKLADAVGPAYPNVKAIFREIGTHAPVIIIPYADNLALSTYGLTESTSGPTQTVNKLWRAGMTIREQAIYYGGDS